MKKMCKVFQSFILPLLLCSFSMNKVAYGYCYEKLMTSLAGAYSQDSVHHYFIDMEVQGFFEASSDLEKAKMAIEYLGEKLRCEREEIVSQSPQHKESCHEFPGVARQVVCVVERDIGHFIYSHDYVDGVSILFNRWD